MNSVNLIGRLANDIEVGKTSSNLSVCNFSIAINNGKDKPAYFIPCCAWRQTADFLGQYAKKGNRLGIVGKLAEEKWQDQQGKTRSKIYVLAERIELLETKEKQEQTSLTGNDKDVTGFTMYRKDTNVDDQFVDNYNPFEEQKEFY